MSNLKRELAVFLLVGFLTVIVDFTIYQCFDYLELESFSISKGFGFIGGSIFAYYANRFLTFKSQSSRAGSFGRFLFVYLCGLVVNVLINSFSIDILSNSALIANPQSITYIAFLLATGISASINFIGMKYFVFTRHHFFKTN